MRKNAFDLKKFREEHEVTQQEVAALCKVSVRTIQSWEANNTMPDKYFALLRAVNNIKGNMVTQVSNSDHYTNVQDTNVQGNLTVGRPSVDSAVEQMMSELSELRKALTDALIVNQKHTDRLLTIIEKEQRRWDNGERNN